MPVFYVVIILIVYYLVKNIFKKKNEEMKLNELKKSLISDEEVYRRKLEEDLGVDEKFRRKYGHIYKEPTYEYNGKSYLEKMVEVSEASFMATAKRVEKNIREGEIKKTNFKIIDFFDDELLRKEPEVKRILKELEGKSFITLEQLNFLKEKYKYWNYLYRENTIKEMYLSAYSSYESGFITKEELEKRRRYFFGDEGK